MLDGTFDLYFIEQIIQVGKDLASEGCLVQPPAQSRANFEVYQALCV